MNQSVEFLCIARSLREANEKRIERSKSEEEKDLRERERETNYKTPTSRTGFFPTKLFPMCSVYVFLTFTHARVNRFSVMNTVYIVTYESTFEATARADSERNCQNERLLAP